MSKLIDALQGRNTGRPPIWLMRQAGRYLPAYRKLKEGRSLLEMFHSPETIAEVTLLPMKLLDLDAAILFSDILSVLDGLSLRYDFQEELGPIVFDPHDQIQVIAAEEAYPHIKHAVALLKRELKVPLLGFAGAPFTIASYIIEGKTSRDFKKTKQWIFQDPDSFDRLMETITEATIAYLNWQIDAGVDAIQLFDSWAHSLADDEFCLYALAPMKKIIKAVQARGIPIILFCRGSCLFAKELAALSPSAISFDWSYSLKEIRKKIPRSIAIQGNLDPMALYASQECLGRKIETLLQDMEGDSGYIFNLGHGILPDTPLENIQFLVDYVCNRSVSVA